MIKLLIKKNLINPTYVTYKYIPSWSDLLDAYKCKQGQLENNKMAACFRPYNNYSMLTKAILARNLKYIAPVVYVFVYIRL